MEDCMRRPFCVEHFSLNNVMGCVSDMKSKEQVVTYQKATYLKEIVFPKPRRAPYIMDSPNRLCCKPISNLPIKKGDPNFDLFSAFLSKDDLEYDLDASGQTGFFRGSPPVRANNPLIHDVQFVRQASTLSSSPGKSSSTRGEKRAPYCGASSSYSGKPTVRVEGFTCGTSDSHCVVPTLA